MHRRRRITALALALVLGVSVPASANEAVPDGAVRRAEAEPARAMRAVGFTLDRSDGNDSKGSLDLASVTITQGRRKDLVRFSTHARVANEMIVPPRGNFAVLINTNDSPRFEYGQYVFYARGRVRGVLMQLKTGRIVDGSAPTSRVNKKTFQTVIQRGKIRSAGTYRLLATSYSEGAPCSPARSCVDFVPNRPPPLPVDHTAPSVDLSVASPFSPAFSSLISATLTFDVDVAVVDDRFGVGGTSWTVEVSEDGGPWTAIGEGSSATAKVDVTGQEGSSYRIRAVAVDRQQNEAISDIETVLVPFDDDWDAVTYSPGDWTTVSSGYAFLGSMHLSAAVDETEPPAEPVAVTGTFTGTQICVIGGDPTADGGGGFVIDGVPAGGFDQDPTSFLGCSSMVAPGLHTFSVTVMREVVAIDGFYVIV